MMRKAAWCKRLLLLTGVGLAALAGSTAAKANVGCSGYPGSPSQDPNSGRPSCRPGGGWCYECEYGYSGGYTLCAETPDQSYMICIDYAY